MWMLIPPTASAVSGPVYVVGVIRCGRTTIIERNIAAATTTRVTAIAGTARRISMPTVTPARKPNAAYPIGTRPRAVKVSGDIQPLALSIGLAQAVIAQL